VNRYKAEIYPRSERFLSIFHFSSSLTWGNFKVTFTAFHLLYLHLTTLFCVYIQLPAKKQSIEQFDDIHAIGPGDETGLKNDRGCSLA
jgi:hypothetical protein